MNQAISNIVLLKTDIQFLKVQAFLAKQATEKENCFKKFQDNALDFSKCAYSFDSVMKSKSKQFDYMLDFMDRKIEKCLKKSKDERQVEACFQEIKEVGEAIKKKLNEEFSDLSEIRVEKNK